MKKHELEIELKGIVRGVFSNMNNPHYKPVLRYTVNDISKLDGLILSEWIFTLRVNGSRIKNPQQYFKQKGLGHLLERRAI